MAEDRDPIEWKSVERVLVVRLRSIGDTVLSTPSLIALQRFLPHAQIDILLEDWVAPLLDGFDAVNNVVRIGTGTFERLQTARKLRRSRYDVVFNLHGGTTSTFLTYATGARHRVGYAAYQYSRLYTHLLSSSGDFWLQQHTHSAEQQLALLGFVEIPVADRPRSRLIALPSADATLEEKFSAEMQRRGAAEAETRAIASVPFALIHPTAAFATKQWATENFARTAEFLFEQGLQTIAVASNNERGVLENLSSESKVPILTFDDLSLPEITALASRAKIFVGNDSGIAHIAAAVETPTVVIFGSSNRNHWRPWTGAPNEIVYEEFACQPCPGYECKEFGEPRCIQSVRVERVISAIEHVLSVPPAAPGGSG